MKGMGYDPALRRDDDMEKARGFGKRFDEWTAALADDVNSTMAIVADEKVPPQARRQLAGALSYLLLQLDLIPDRERAGAVDDALVIRVAYGIAAEHLDSNARAGRLINDDEAIREFLGDALYSRLRRHVTELCEREVRGRKADQIIHDARARADMKRELDETVAKLKPPHIDNEVIEEEIERAVINYLKIKLGG